MKFYRYETKYYADLDEYENVGRAYPKLELTEFFLAKETPKCWRITYNWDTNLKYTKLVRKNARKKYAWPTKEEAAKSLLARKKKLVEILTKKLENARMELNIAKVLNEK